MTAVLGNSYHNVAAVVAVAVDAEVIPRSTMDNDLIATRRDVGVYQT